jgi:hypothetical protein
VKLVPELIAGQSIPGTRWTVIARVPHIKRRYLCRCECGREKEVDGYLLTHGGSLSCGCLRDERTRETCCTHADSKSAEYKIWAGIVKRCYDSNATSYPRYGGSGVTMSPLWRHDYEAFLAHVGRRPSQKHSIDRYPNKNGNYEPGNVRWANPFEQGENMTTNVLVEAHGELLTISAWSRKTGIKRPTISERRRA